ncbi:hypothetical protein [Saccharothrix longispora]|uniref:hypothetical protein n=1 Tax=Saccharothrix longispora TaxID=33920 RepID=UPI0028FD0325|nr:hypothetical protein [Saccharothrix longispora]MDU0294030.1 hypothetical protein [Saccharothrix longispora]
MRHRTGRTVTGGWRRVLAVAAVVGLAPVAAPPHAVAADCAGVAVVVDFRSLGGGVRTGCAAGDPASGTGALTAAGFGFTFAARQPGFVCRIDGLPGQAADPCVGTSPTSAHWSYWHARPGGSWTYSSTSASAYDPAAGTVEGWSFGAGEPPGVAPPAPAPKPQPPAPQPPAPQPPAPNPGQPNPGQPAPGQPAPRPTADQPGQPVQPGQPTGEPGPTTTPAAGAPPSSSDAPTGGTSASSPTSAGASTAPDATSVAVDPTAGTSSGGTAGFATGIVVIALLAGLGVWTARRRAKAAE